MFEKALFWRMIIDSFSHFRSFLWCCFSLALVSNLQPHSRLFDTAVHPERMQCSSKWHSPWAWPPEKSLLLWIFHHLTELFQVLARLLKIHSHAYKQAQVIMGCACRKGLEVSGYSVEWVMATWGWCYCCGSAISREKLSWKERVGKGSSRPGENDK